MDYQSLHMKTVAELRQLAKAQGVRLPAGTKKAVMIELLLEAESSADAPARLDAFTDAPASRQLDATDVAAPPQAEGGPSATPEGGRASVRGGRGAKAEAEPQGEGEARAVNQARSGRRRQSEPSEAAQAREAAAPKSSDASAAAQADDAARPQPSKAAAEVAMPEPSKAARRADAAKSQSTERATGKNAAGSRSSEAANRRDGGAKSKSTDAANRRDGGAKSKSTDAANRRDVGARSKSTDAANRRDGAKSSPSEAANRGEGGAKSKSSEAARKHVEVKPERSETTARKDVEAKPELSEASAREGVAAKAASGEPVVDAPRRSYAPAARNPETSGSGDGKALAEQGAGESGKVSEAPEVVEPSRRAAPQNRLVAARSTGDVQAGSPRLRANAQGQRPAVGANARYASGMQPAQRAGADAANRQVPRQPGQRFTPRSFTAAQTPQRPAAQEGAQEANYVETGSARGRREGYYNAEYKTSNPAVPELLAAGDCMDGAGVLEIQQDGYGFLRAENCLPGANDVYISIAQIRRFNLRMGDYVVGKTRPQREGDRYSAMLYITSVNGQPPEEAASRPRFEDLVPIYPDERLRLEQPGQSGQGDMSLRLIDMLAPIGKGQRGMIVSQPKAGKTTLLKKVANAITAQYPEVKLIVMLIDERPEEVTDMKRSIDGEVIYSTFDEAPENHVRVSEMVLERAQRLVEMGQDVVVLMDSITRLARAYNLVITPTGRSLSGGLDPGALFKPKRFFGAARNIENGGSLTVIATALVDTGSRMDDIIFEEFKGTGNMELHLDRKLSDRRVFPAIDMMRSGTRREELLLTESELEGEMLVRRVLSGGRGQEMIEQIISLMGKTASNAEFFEKMKGWVAVFEKEGYSLGGKGQQRD